MGPAAAAAAYAAAVWTVCVELAPWMLVGAALAGLLHAALPPGFIHRQLRGPSGVLKAVLIGVPLPLCSCGVIPAGVGLKADGASDGAAVGFLIATPQTGVDSMLVSASFFGWPFALMKVVAALLSGLGGGLLTEALSPAAAPIAPSSAPAPRRSAGERARAGLAHAVEMIRSIYGWLTFGVLVSAAITAFLPADALAWSGAGGPLPAMLGALLISVPLYVCATASVPLAAALVGAGMPTGAAMVFLMAGPATNLATLGAVGRTFGRRALAVYLGTLVVGSMAFGLIYEAIFGAMGPTAGAHHHDHSSASGTAAALLLTLLVASFAAQDLKGRWARWRQTMSDQSHAPEQVLPVEGMTCGGCVSRLERVLRKVEGVEAVHISLEGKSAALQGTASRAALIAAIEGAGFEVPSASPPPNERAAR